MHFIYKDRVRATDRMSDKEFLACREGIEISSECTPYKE